MDRILSIYFVKYKQEKKMQIITLRKSEVGIQQYGTEEEEYYKVYSNGVVSLMIHKKNWQIIKDKQFWIFKEKGKSEIIEPVQKKRGRKPNIK